MNTAPSMYAALTLILKGRESVPFEVKAWEGEGAGDALDEFGDIPTGHYDQGYEGPGTLYQVIGGGEALLGHILDIVTEQGAPVVTYWTSS